MNERYAPQTTLDEDASRRRFWAYATAFGAAWGVFEVTVGTFLHTLRLPLAGPVLAAVGAALLIAQRQLIPVRGITLATGLVAAACKAISPGGSILGPMIGIASEALLLELVLLAAPRAALSAAVAGGSVPALPILQKLAMQVLFYGGAVLELYLEALRKLAAVFEVDGAMALRVGAASLGAMSAIGALLGLSGRAVGRQVAVRLAQDAQTALDVEVSAGAGAGDLHGTALRAASPLPGWLPGPLATWRDRLLAAAAATAIALQLGGGLWPSLLGLATLLLSLAVLRPEALHRLWRPRFWLFTLALASLSGLLLGPRDLRLPGPEQALLSSSGLHAGLLMVARGALVFALTSWATAASDGRRLLGLARRLGLRRLAEAVGAALALMPQLQAALTPPQAVRAGVHRLGLLQRLTAGVTVATRLAERTARIPRAEVARMRLAAVIGPRASGKTTTLVRLHRDLVARGLGVAGVCQPADDDRRGYDLLALATGERRRLATWREAPSPVDGTDAGVPPFAGEDPMPLGFEFSTDVWAWARRQLEHDLGWAAVVVVDELGRLEAAGRGHMVALRRLLKFEASAPDGSAASSPRLLLLGVQAAVASEIAQQVGGFDLKLQLPASEAEAQAFVDLVLTVTSEACARGHARRGTAPLPELALGA